MIDRTDDGAVALIRMSHEPANVLTIEFAEALWAELDRARGDDAVRAVILTGTGSAFSAGLELFRLVDGGAEYVRALLDRIGALFQGLRDYPKPLVAAVNGHAIAGGGVMACACDYRVMSEGGGKIGLPELSVGVPFPAVALEIVRNTIPARHHREVLLLGRTFSAEEAGERGFVDEIVPSEALIDRAREIAVDLASIPPATYAITKRQLSRPAGQAEDLEKELARIWSAPETHAHVRGYLERTLGRSSAR